jgi:transposase-like protein
MASIGEGGETGNIRNVIRIDEGEIRNHLDGLVKTSVEEVLNQYLEQEADHLCGAKRYERSTGRVDTRSGSYNRKLQTKAGEVTLQVPRRVR